MAGIPAEIESLLKAHLGAIAKLFKAPKITLIVRAPQFANASGDLILTSDNLTLVQMSLQSMMIREAHILAGTPEQMTVVEKPRTEVEPNMYGEDMDPRARPSGNNFKRG